MTIYRIFLTLVAVMLTAYWVVKFTAMVKEKEDMIDFVIRAMLMVLLYGLVLLLWWSDKAMHLGMVLVIASFAIAVAIPVILAIRWVWEDFQGCLKKIKAK